MFAKKSSRCALDNLGVKKVLGPLKSPETYQIMTFSCKKSKNHKLLKRAVH